MSKKQNSKRREVREEYLQKLEETRKGEFIRIDDFEKWINNLIQKK